MQKKKKPKRYLDNKTIQNVIRYLFYFLKASVDKAYKRKALD